MCSLIQCFESLVWREPGHIFIFAINHLIVCWNMQNLCRSGLKYIFFPLVWTLFRCTHSDVLWCISMGFRHADPWVESHMWPQQQWGQRSPWGHWYFWKMVISIMYFDVFPWDLDTMILLQSHTFDFNKSGFKCHLKVIDLLLKFWKSGKCPHIGCTFTRLGYNDPWVELYMWP